MSVSSRLSIFAVLLVSVMGACAPPAVPAPAQNAPPTPGFETAEGDPGMQTLPGTPPSREPRECPKLDSQLYQLTQATDAIALAKQLGFRVAGDKVQVLFTLASEDAEFLVDLGVELGTQSGTQVQAFVPVDQLCDLANAEGVLAIRPAAQAVPQ